MTCCEAVPTPIFAVTSFRCSAEADTDVENAIINATAAKESTISVSSTSINVSPASEKRDWTVTSGLTAVFPQANEPCVMAVTIQN